MVKYNIAMREWTFILLFGLLVSPVWSQQNTIYTMQEHTRIGENPAYTGNEDIFDLVLLTRQQWVGFEGAPTSYYLAAHAPLRNQKAGLGFDFQRNTSGPYTSNAFFLSYAYTIHIKEAMTLSFGLRGGFSNYQITYTDLLVLDPGDQLFESNVKGLFLPNVGTGVHFTFRNYFFDFSIPILLRNEFSPDKTERVGLQNKEERSYHFHTGAEFHIAEGVKIRPGLMLWMSNGTPTVLDLRVSTVLKDVATLGLVYRMGGSFGGSITYKVVDNFIIGYAYELPLNNNFQVKSGTHEVVLGLDFQFLNSKTQSPRRF